MSANTWIFFSKLKMVKTHWTEQALVFLNACHRTVAHHTLRSSTLHSFSHVSRLHTVSYTVYTTSSGLSSLRAQVSCYTGFNLSLWFYILTAILNTLMARWPSPQYDHWVNSHCVHLTVGRLSQVFTDRSQHSPFSEVTVPWTDLNILWRILDNFFEIYIQGKN